MFATARQVTSEGQGIATAMVSDEKETNLVLPADIDGPASVPACRPTLFFYPRCSIGT